MPLILAFHLQIFAGGVDELSAIDVFAALFPMTSMPENETLEYVRQQVCDEQRLKELFHFPNDTVADDVHNELCNLTTDQFDTLINQFVQDFSWTQLELEVVMFVSVLLMAKYLMYSPVIFEQLFLKSVSYPSLITAVGNTKVQKLLSTVSAFIYKITLLLLLNKV